MGKNGNRLFSWAPKSLQTVTAAMKLKDFLDPWKKIYDKLSHHFADKGAYSQICGCSSHAWMWELEPKVGWVLKIWCFWTVVLEKTVESPLDCKEIQPVNPKGSQPRILIAKTDAEAELQYLGHLMWRTDSLEKTLMLGKIESRKRRGRQRTGRIDDITESMDMSLSEFQEMVKDRESWCAAVYGVAKSQIRLSN